MSWLVWYVNAFPYFICHIQLGKLSVSPTCLFDLAHNIISRFSTASCMIALTELLVAAPLLGVHKDFPMSGVLIMIQTSFSISLSDLIDLYKGLHAVTWESSQFC